MTYKKKVLHLIDGLGRGGAETLLVGVVKALPEFEHLIVSLDFKNEFKDELIGIELIQIQHKGFASIPLVAYKVNKIIKQYQIEIVHAHLYWSTIISRLATPGNIKLINSYHNILYGANGAKYPLHARLLDKFTYSKRIITLCVSSEVKKDLSNYIGINTNVEVMYNYIEDAFFKNYRPVNSDNRVKGTKLRAVAVGSFKVQKNYETIVNAFSILNKAGLAESINLDIYGKGELLENLSKKCISEGISNINFKGAVNNIPAQLPNYDIYIIASTYEGFGIAVVEAMAVGLPVIVSDISVLKEVTGGIALFFNPLSAQELADKITTVLNGAVDLQKLSYQGHAFSKKYSKEAYLSKLKDFYLYR